MSRFDISRLIGVPSVWPSKTPDRILTVSVSFRWVTMALWPGTRRSRSGWMSASDSARRGGSRRRPRRRRRRATHPRSLRGTGGPRCYPRVENTAVGLSFADEAGLSHRTPRKPAVSASSSDRHGRPAVVSPREERARPVRAARSQVGGQQRRARPDRAGHGSRRSLRAGRRRGQDRDRRVPVAFARRLRKRRRGTALTDRPQDARRCRLLSGPRRGLRAPRCRPKPA